MSEREEIQKKIYNALEENKDYWDAPYGILMGMKSIGKGKIRTVVFGVSRYLDAIVEIWSPNRIVIRGEGGLAYKVEDEFKSAYEAIERLRKVARREDIPKQDEDA